jgi:hypothetical protein
MKCVPFTFTKSSCPLLKRKVEQDEKTAVRKSKRNVLRTIRISPRQGEDSDDKLLYKYDTNYANDRQPATIFCVNAESFKLFPTTTAPTGYYIDKDYYSDKQK